MRLRAQCLLDVHIYRQLRKIDSVCSGKGSGGCPDAERLI
jgi:hypothetical protein